MTNYKLILSTIPKIGFISIACLALFACGGGGSTSNSDPNNDRNTSFDTLTRSTLTLHPNINQCAEYINTDLRVETTSGFDSNIIYNASSAVTFTANISDMTEAPFDLRLERSDTKVMTFIDAPHGNYNFKGDILNGLEWQQDCFCAPSTVIFANASEDTWITYGNRNSQVDYNNNEDYYYRVLNLCDPDLENIIAYDFNLGLYEIFSLADREDPLHISLSKEMESATVSSQNQWDPLFYGYMPHPIFGDYYGYIAQRSPYTENYPAFRFIPSQDVPRNSLIASQTEHTNNQENPLIRLTTTQNGSTQTNPSYVRIETSNMPNSLSNESDILFEAPNINPISVDIRDDGVNISGLASNNFDFIAIRLTKTINTETPDINFGYVKDYWYYMPASGDSVIFTEWQRDFETLTSGAFDLSIRLTDYHAIEGYENALRYIFSNGDRSSSHTSLSTYFYKIN